MLYCIHVCWICVHKYNLFNNNPLQIILCILFLWAKNLDLVIIALYYVHLMNTLEINNSFIDFCGLQFIAM